MFPSPSMSASFISSCISFAFNKSLKKKQISPLHWERSLKNVHAEHVGPPGPFSDTLSLSLTRTVFIFKPGTQKGRVFHRAFVEPVLSCGFNNRDKKRDKAPLLGLALV